MNNVSPNSRRKTPFFYLWLLILIGSQIPMLTKAQTDFDLALTKELSDGQDTEVAVGDSVTYTINIFNQGDINADNITIADYLPPGTVLADNDWSVNSGTASIVLPYGNAGLSGTVLIPGATTSIDITLAITEFTNPSVINLAEISYATDDSNGVLVDVDSTPNDYNGDDFIGGDNTLDNANGDEDDHDFAGVIVIEEPMIFDLSLIKELSIGQDSEVNVGDTVSYTISVSNEGTIDADNILITEYLPAGTSLVNDDWVLNPDGTAYTLLPFGNAGLSGSILVPGATTSVEVSLLVEDYSDGEIINLAEIGNATDDEGTVIVDVDSTPNNEVETEDDQDGAAITILPVPPPPPSDCSTPYDCGTIEDCVEPMVATILCPEFCLDGTFAITEIHSLFQCSIEILDDGCIEYIPLPGMDLVGYDYLELIATNENGECVTLEYQFVIGDCVEPCTASAGEIDALDNNVCYGETLNAYLVADPVIPDGYAFGYVLSSGEEQNIVAVSAEPWFTVGAEGAYTIHTIVYDPSEFDFASYNTGFEIYDYFEGEACGSFLLYGAAVLVEDCCFADVGTITPTQDGGYCQSENITFTQTEDAFIPEGFELYYVLTDEAGAILDFDNQTTFVNQFGSGTYTIFTVVYDPVLIEPTDYTDIQSLMEAFILPAAGFCGDITLSGVDVVIEDCCLADVGAVVPTQEVFCQFENITIIQTEEPFIPDGFELYYVLTDNLGGILDFDNQPTFVNQFGPGTYTIFTTVYDPTLIEPTDYTDIQSLLDVFVLSEAGFCGDITFNGAVCIVDYCPLPCEVVVGELDALNSTACVGETISAYAVAVPFVPEGFVIEYALSFGEEQTILEISNEPNFIVTEPGAYAIHTLVYNLDDFDPWDYTTGGEMYAQFEGGICGGFLTNGANVLVEECVDPCTAYVGGLVPAQESFCHTDEVTGVITEEPVVPAGYRVRYILTNYLGEVLSRKANPNFGELEPGTYTIFTVVFDPDVLTLPPYPSIQELLNVFIEAEEGFCGDITFNGATCVVDDCTPPPPPCVSEPIYACTEPVTPVIICPEFCALEEGNYNIISTHTTFECSITDLGNGCIRYVPLPGFDLEDQIEITACNDEGVCETVYAYISIGNCDDLPPPPPPCTANQDLCIPTFAMNPVPTLICLDFCGNGMEIEGIDATFDCVFEPTSEVCFEFLPLPGMVGQETITITACNSSGNCEDASVYVTISDDCSGNVTANNVPVAINDNEWTDYGTPVVIDVLGNDSDPDGDLFYVCDYTQPANGTVVQIGNLFEYTPNDGYSGVEVFSYTICDGNGGSDVATVFVDVQAAPNEAPVATDDSVETDGNTPIVIDVTGNDSDPDGDNVYVCGFTQPANGTVTELDGDLVYTPNDGYSGTDAFNYTICDDNGGEDTGTVVVEVTETACLSETTLCRWPFSVSIEHTLICIDFCNEDYLIQEMTSIYQCSLSEPENNCFYYLPLPGFEGDDTVIVTGCNEAGDCETAYVYVTVNENCSDIDTPVGNQAPVAVNDTAYLAGSNSIVLDVLWNDYDAEGDNFEICAMTLPAHGTIADLGNGLFEYYPAASFTGLDAFSYSICDEYGNYDYGLVIIYGDAGKPDNSTETVMNMLSSDPNGLRVDFESEERVDCLESLEIPNVFTPNNDGVNDVFTISEMNTCLAIDKQIELTVFNTVGSVVYQDNEYHLTQSWRPNETIEAGTYFYSLRVIKGKEVAQRQGFIEIRR